MFNQHFGYYLMSKGYIDAKQLQRVLSHRRSTHVKLGLLAINEGYMNPQQVEEINNKQMTADKRFGELALECGYLTQDQLYTLLSAQKSNHLLLGQALTELGYMNLYQITLALHQFKKEHGLTDEQFSAIKQGKIEALMSLLLPTVSPFHKDLYRDYLTLFAKNLIRFVDDDIRFELKTHDYQEKADWFVRQEICGEIALHTHMAADTGSFLTLAERYAKESITEPDELAQASVGEFLNLHNGIFLVNMSNHGIELNLEPQEVVHDVVVAFGESRITCIAVHLSTGSFDLLLSPKPLAVNGGSLASAAVS